MTMNYQNRKGIKKSLPKLSLWAKIKPTSTIDHSKICSIETSPFNLKKKIAMYKNHSTWYWNTAVRSLLNIKLRLKLTIPILLLMKTSQIKSFQQLLLLKIFVIWFATHFESYFIKILFETVSRKFLIFCFCQIEHRKFPFQFEDKIRAFFTDATLDKVHSRKKVMPVWKGSIE